MTKYLFSFKNGEVFYNKSQIFLFPLNSFLILYDYLLQKYTKTEIEELFLNCSKEDCFIFYSEFKSKEKKTNIKSYIEYLNKYGLGISKLIKCTEEEIIIKIENCSLSKYYFKLFNKKPTTPLEYIYASLMCNYLSYLYNKNIIITYSLKNENIYFNFKIGTSSIKFSNEIKYNFQTKNLFSSSLIKKILINNLIKYKHDLLYIWKLCGVAIPYFMLIQIFNNLNTEQKFIESLGRSQGRSATKLQSNLFGFKKGITLAKNVISQSELLGGGTIIIKNETPFKFNIKNSIREILPKNNNSSYLYPIEIYFYNLVRGAYEEGIGFSTKLKIETNFVSLITTSEKLEELKELKLILEFKKILE